MEHIICKTSVFAFAVMSFAAHPMARNDPGHWEWTSHPGAGPRAPVVVRTRERIAAPPATAPSSSGHLEWRSRILGGLRATLATRYRVWIPDSQQGHNGPDSTHKQPN